MIVKCPKCGVKNRISGATDSKQMYRCGKCGTRLPAPAKITDEEQAIGAIIRPPDRERQGDAEASRSATSYFSPTRVLSWFKIRENQAIFSLVFLALLLHLAVVPYAHMLVFDESYYVPEARSIIHHTGILNPEHPSLAKLFIASGILTLGDNPWGWRIPAVVFGLASIVIFYLICRRLTKKSVALVASFLLVSESLTFILSGVAMLDVFSLTFMLLAFFFYLHDRYVFSGASLALATLCKLTGLLGVFVILAHWLIRKRRQPLQNIALFVLVAFAGFMLLLPLSDFLASGHWMSPISRVSQMLEASKNLTFEKAAAASSPVSRPWTWILNPKGIAFVNQTHFTEIINPTIWILIIPSMVYMLYEFVRRRTNVSLFVLLWFAATYLLWIPLVLVTDRQTYVWYFYPAVGAVCIAVGFAITKIWDFASQKRSTVQRRLIKGALIGYLVLDALFFLNLAPIIASLASYITASNTIR